MKFKITTIINTKPAVIYSAWLSSTGHTSMTGGEAECSDQVGGSFTAWDGYISGTNLELAPNQRIVQSWRTTEFEASEADSKIEIILKEAGNSTELTLIHTALPDHGEQYRQGWFDHYFKPMAAYFGSSV